MDFFSGHYMHDIVQGLHGPGKFRFFIQPLIAILLGFRDGRLDAKEGRPPYFLHLLKNPQLRPELWKSGFSSFAKPFILAWIVDTAFQILVLGHWNPFEALIVALCLIVLPYAMARGLTNRMTYRDHEHV